MSESTFAVTRVFGEQVFARFSNALSELRSDPKLVERLSIYDRVSCEELANFLSSAFWASLSPEEGRYHPFRLSLGPPSPIGSDYSFTQLKTFSPSEISDIAPVLANSHRSIGVWYSDTGVLKMWGIADLGYWDINVTANGPGQLLFSMLGRDTSFAVAICGSWWGFVDKTRVPLTWAYTGGMRPDPTNFQADEVDIYLQAFKRSRSYESIARSMLKHGHGGTLLIVPEESDSWQQSCSIRYEADNLFQEIRENVDQWETEFQREIDAGRWFSYDGSTERSRERATQSLDLVAQLTAVDGATIMGRDLSINGFGAKLSPLDPSNKPKDIRRSRPFEDAPYELIQLPALGGTRHQSAAQFVYDHKGSVAIVCSQDGQLSSLSWDSTEGVVVFITNLEFAL